MDSLWLTDVSCFKPRTLVSYSLKFLFYRVSYNTNPPNFSLSNFDEKWITNVIFPKRELEIPKIYRLKLQNIDFFVTPLILVNYWPCRRPGIKCTINNYFHKYNNNDNNDSDWLQTCRNDLIPEISQRESFSCWLLGLTIWEQD